MLSCTDCTAQSTPAGMEDTDVTVPPVQQSPRTVEEVVNHIRPVAPAYGRHDCGFCVIELRPSKSEGDLEQMYVTSFPRAATDEEAHSLIKVLQSIVDHNKQFAAVYDLREYAVPRIEHMRLVADFIRATLSQWDILIRVATVVIADSWRASISKKLVMHSMSVIGITPACPFTICHDLAAAASFIDDHSRETLVRTPLSTCSLLKPLAGSSLSTCCLKTCETWHSLASEFSVGSSEESFSETSAVCSGSCGSLPTMRALENGDVQVVQSLHSISTDVMCSGGAGMPWPSLRLVYWLLGDLKKRLARPFKSFWKAAAAGDQTRFFSTSSFASTFSLMECDGSSHSELFTCDSLLSLYACRWRSRAAALKAFANQLVPAAPSFCIKKSSCWSWAAKPRPASARKASSGCLSMRR